ncbi:hypothetical protein DYBT9275_03439 [Dyadobacter sp. CECT 9275]|uniref:Uncharacterized protein n=1 Tax=Dyadobacter helix TaxID=2822344 RepID=A0A916JCN3_9BACT|nr:hypothetical protein [Dyadobacter sp. CECT 9275]CAG5004753.1 hypothetical protein DYBT9275_03439 [Dyadobacter sp. CECT 9275]
MSSQQESLHTLSEIRDLMERSSKFLSLSGLSGVFAGIFALAGAGIAYLHFKTNWLTEILIPLGAYPKTSRREIISFLMVDGLLVLILSLAVGILFTVRKARRRGLSVWNGTSKRLLLAMLIPLATGGIFCLAMLYYGFIWLVFPATLLFYGLALVNASRFTYPEVFYLGISEIAIGCISLFLTGYSIFFWAAGFGLLHILYGLTMHNKYDRKKGLPSGLKTPLKMLLLGIAISLTTKTASAQVNPDSLKSKVTRLYEKETIYMLGSNTYVKNNMLYRGQKALRSEFMISPGGMDLYLRSRRSKNISLVISVAGSAGSVISLISGDRNALRKFFWVSLGTGVVSSVLGIRANNLRDQAVWLRNRDAMAFKEAYQ